MKNTTHPIGANMTTLSSGAAALLQGMREYAVYGADFDQTYLQPGDLTPEQNGYLTQLKKLGLVELVGVDEDSYGTLTHWYKVTPA
jgi:hypothetical protein